MTSKARHSAGFSPQRRWLLYLTGAGVWSTGCLWLVLHYFFEKQGDFGPTTNPAEPWLLRAHGFFSFAAIWLLGLLWGVHISKLWPYGKQRWSGGVLTGAAIWLVVSGYLLYYVGEERTRSWISAAHWITGVLILGFFFWHILRPNRRRRETRKLHERNP